MLLADKVANRAVRQTLEEAQTTMALPVTLSRHFTRPVQVYLVTPVIHSHAGLVWSTSREFASQCSRRCGLDIPTLRQVCYMQSPVRGAELMAPLGTRSSLDHRHVS